MEELERMWPMLTNAQREAITDVAHAFLYADPQPRAEYLTTKQVSSEYNIPQRTVSEAASLGKLGYVVPNGCSRGRRFMREDVERWLQASRQT